MSEAELREALCRTGRSLHARGYLHGTTGNLSARLGTGFLVSATDACLGELVPEALVEVAADGTPAAGQAAPSKALLLHRRIYAAVAGARCVLHSHSSHLVRLSLDVPADEARDDLLPPITPYFVMKVGHVPLIAYRRPGDPAAADAVVAAIERADAGGAPIRAVVLSRLGPTVWHESPAAAGAALEELEETARLWLACRPAATPLGEAQIDELRQHFGARW